MVLHVIGVHPWAMHHHPPLLICARTLLSAQLHHCLMLSRVHLVSVANAPVVRGVNHSRA
jgi:hypothetical protein